MLALAGLVSGGLRLDEWARKMMLEGDSASPCFSACDQQETAWHPCKTLNPPLGPKSNLSAGLGPVFHDCAAPVTESWPFSRMTGADSRVHKFIRVEATGYTSCPSETDSLPRLTAASTPTAPGTIALSRDLIRTYTPGAPFDFGDKVLIPGVGVFEVWDTMNARWSRRADIWFELKEDARDWGIREVFLTRVTEEAPTMAGTIH